MQCPRCDESVLPLHVNPRRESRNPLHHAAPQGNTMVLQRFMEAIPVCLAVSPNPQQHLTDHRRRRFYTAHGPLFTHRRCRLPSTSSPTASNPNVCLTCLYWMMLSLEVELSKDDPEELESWMASFWKQVQRKKSCWGNSKLIHKRRTRKLSTKKLQAKIM
ncbi:uncharacterized protein [Miscanthus floridulus]|uniref:uncharacterized protein isoform X2 n=1 Tax=Miscanthus floridulus TaxID=154761 RepID=UPI0034588C8B